MKSFLKKMDNAITKAFNPQQQQIQQQQQQSTPSTATTQLRPAASAPVAAPVAAPIATSTSSSTANCSSSAPIVSTSSTTFSSSSPSSPFHLSQLELDVFNATNRLRTQPQSFLPLLHQRRAEYPNATAKHRLDPTYHRSIIQMVETVACVDEAIAYCQQAKPVGPLTLSNGLILACRDHVTDLGLTGTAAHDGTDGSNTSSRLERYGQWIRKNAENFSMGFDLTGESVVLDLFIDDGIKDRGHRINLFLPDVQRVGIACGPHIHFGICCVQDFAYEYKDFATEKQLQIYYAKQQALKNAAANRPKYALPTSNDHFSISSSKPVPKEAQAGEKKVTIDKLEQMPQLESLVRSSGALSSQLNEIVDRARSALTSNPSSVITLTVKSGRSGNAHIHIQQGFSWNEYTWWWG